MKNSKRKYVALGVVACVVLTAAGVVLIWALDNVFSGLVVDALNALIGGVDEQTGAVRFLKDRLAMTGFLMVFCVSALVSGAGAYCAYHVYKKQQSKLDKALADAARAEQLAQRETQRKSDLITYLAHDLKTPLASVIAYLSLLTEAPQLPTDQRAKYTGIALNKAYRLEELIGELFEVIRFNLQSIELRREDIHLKLMLEQLADEFYPILLSEGKSVVIDCADDLLLRGDPDKLARVFNNLLKNAAAYSPENAVIRLTAGRVGRQVEIVCANTGAAIPPEQLKRIFEKFYRLDASRATRTGGAGLGLAIAKEIVEAHHGTITATSDERETAFTVTLPA